MRRAVQVWLLAAGAAALLGAAVAAACILRPPPKVVQAGLFGPAAHMAPPRTGAAAPAATPWTAPLPPAPPAAAAPPASTAPVATVGPPASKAPLLAYADGADPVTVRDPLDPQNPYQGQYAAYDAWIYVRAQLQAQRAGLTGKTDQLYTLRVDAEGWPQPMRVTERHDLCDDGHTPRPHAFHQIQAWGVMDYDMAQAQQRDRLQTRAGNLPRIPQWLAQRPPRMALVLPDGEVVTQGALDSAAALPDGGYFRYSAAGAELGQTAPSAEWWTLYFKDFDQLKAQHPDSVWEEQLGCVVRLNAGTGQPQEIYDYHGTRLPGSKPPLDRAARDYTWLDGAELPDLYAAQNGGAHRSI